MADRRKALSNKRWLISQQLDTNGHCYRNRQRLGTKDANGREYRNHQRLVTPRWLIAYDWALQRNRSIYVLFTLMTRYDRVAMTLLDMQHHTTVTPKSVRSQMNRFAVRRMGYIGCAGPLR